MDRFATCNMSNMPKKQTLHQMNCATLAGTMNAKPTATLNILISTNGHAAGNFFQFALEGRTFQVATL